MSRNVIKEEYLEKLTFGHKSTQRQLLEKLYNQVEIFVKKYGYINQKNAKDCQELLLLQDFLGHDSQFIGMTCSEFLLHLVKQRYVCGNYIATTAIALTALKRPLKNYMQMVLSILENEKNEKFTLTTLTRIYSNVQIDSIQPLLYELQDYMNIRNLYVEDETRSFDTILKFLKPFIAYAVSKSKNSVQFVTMLLDTASIMFQTDEYYGTQNASKIFHHIVEVLAIQGNLQSEKSVYLEMIAKLVLWYLTHKEYFFDTPLHCKLIILLLTSIWNKVSKRNLDNLQQPFGLLKEMMILGITDDEKFVILERNGIFVCSLMMTKLDNSSLVHVLEIVLLILQRHFNADAPSSNVFLEATVLAFPLLQILHDAQHGNNAGKFAQKLAGNIFANIQEILKLPYKHNRPSMQIPKNSLFGCYSAITNTANYSMDILDILLRDKKACLAWLSDFKRNLVSEDNIILILSSILVHSFEKRDVFENALDCLVELCKMDAVLVLQFLPLLIYCLNEDRFKEVKISILHTIPKLALGKMVISSILKFVTFASTNDSLLPVSLAMMTSLWIKQPRVFPYLHQLLSKELIVENITTHTWFDWMLAKAACVLDICKLKASQYGKDMIVILSSMIETLIGIDELLLGTVLMQKLTSALAMIIEAIKYICLEKVIDIESIWKAIVLKVQSKKHHAILQSLCSLCGIIPGVLLSETREVFFDEVLQYLWYLIKNEDEDVATHAFASISCFPPPLIKVKYLPEHILQVVCERLKSRHKTNDDDDITYDPLQESCPGFSYMELLRIVQPKALPGFRELMTSVLQLEVDTLPRGVGRKLFMRPTQSMVSQIPDVLLKQYEASTRPGILPGVAAGVLACYDPSLDLSDQLTKRQMISNMEKHKHMLTSLLQDFTIHANDWCHAIYAPKLWSSFMGKVYEAFVIGRTAELRSNNEKGLITDTEIFQDELTTAKYWARDQIMNQLKTASKGSPKAQGNSIYGLAALANAVLTHEEGRIKTEESHQYVGMRTWLLKAADTIAVVFDGNMKTKNKPFQWCQQVSSGTSSASSVIARCSAALVFGELVRPLLSLDTNRIVVLVETLKDRCPGKSKAGTSSTMQLHVGLAFGLLLSRLSQTGFSEIASSSEFGLKDCFTMMERIVFDETIEDKEGVVVGFGLALSTALLHNECCEFGVYCFEKLKETFCNNFCAETLTTLSGQTACFSLVCLTNALFTNEKISQEKFKEVYGIVKRCVKESAKSSDIYASLGILNATVLSMKSTELMENVNNDIEAWTRLLSNKNASTLLKLGALKGIYFTFGAADMHFEVEKQVDETAQLKSCLKKVVTLIETSSDNLVSLTAARLLGQLHLSVTVTNTGSGNLPLSYSYLGDISILSSVFDAFLSVQTMQSRDTWKVEQLRTCFEALIQTRCDKLPPVNWTLVLSPLLRIYSKDVELEIFKFATKFSNCDSNISLWLASSIQTTSFTNLSDKIRMYIFENATTILPCLSNNKQKTLLEDLAEFAITSSSVKEDMLRCVLAAWLSVTEMPVPIQSTIGYVIEGVKKLRNIKELPDMLKDASDTFAQLLYNLFQENWRVALSQLEFLPELKIGIHRAMLPVDQTIEVEDILSVVSFHKKTKDASSEMMSLLRVLVTCHLNDVMKATLVQLKNELRSHFLQQKLSLEEQHLYYLIIYLTSPSARWFVCPVETLMNPELSELISKVLRDSEVYFETG